MNIMRSLRSSNGDVVLVAAERVLQARPEAGALAVRVLVEARAGQTATTVELVEHPVDHAGTGVRRIDVPSSASAASVARRILRMRLKFSSSES